MCWVVEMLWIEVVNSVFFIVMIGLSVIFIGNGVLLCCMLVNL